MDFSTDQLAMLSDLVNKELEALTAKGWNNEPLEALAETIRELLIPADMRDKILDKCPERTVEEV